MQRLVNNTLPEGLLATFSKQHNTGRFIQTIVVAFKSVM